MRNTDKEGGGKKREKEKKKKILHCLNNNIDTLKYVFTYVITIIIIFQRSLKNYVNV